MMASINPHVQCDQVALLFVLQPSVIPVNILSVPAQVKCMRLKEQKEREGGKYKINCKGPNTLKYKIISCIFKTVQGDVTEILNNCLKKRESTLRPFLPCIKLNFLKELSK